MNGLSTFFSVCLCLACRSLLEGNDFFEVPEVIDELSSHKVLAMELVQGVPLDRCVDLDQETRNTVRVVSAGTWIPFCHGISSAVRKGQGGSRKVVNSVGI